MKAAAHYTWLISEVLDIFDVVFMAQRAHKLSRVNRSEWHLELGWRWFSLPGEMQVAGSFPETWDVRPAGGGAPGSPGTCGW